MKPAGAFWLPLPKFRFPEMVPPILFKYYPPERLNVLTHGSVRISQRQVVNDPDDFRPPFTDAAPADVLARFVNEQIAQDELLSPRLRSRLATYILENRRGEMRDELLGNLKTPNVFGMLCLTDNPSSGAMWCRYAAQGRGFVLAFDVAVLAGTFMPRLEVRRARYTEQPIDYVSEGVLNRTAFYQKSRKWARESEWRGTAPLSRFPVVAVDEDDWPVHVCSLPAGAVLAVIVRTGCTVERELRHLLAIDCRYRTTILELLA